LGVYDSWVEHASSVEQRIDDVDPMAREWPLRRSLGTTTQRDDDAPAALLSPPSFLHEVAPAYSGLAPTADLPAWSDPQHRRRTTVPQDDEHPDADMHRGQMYVNWQAGLSPPGSSRPPASRKPSLAGSGVFGG